MMTVRTSPSAIAVEAGKVIDVVLTLKGR
jgi:hypothetical protein